MCVCGVYALARRNGKRFRKEKLIVKKRMAINIRVGWDGAKAADSLFRFLSIEWRRLVADCCG